MTYHISSDHSLKTHKMTRPAVTKVHYITKFGYATGHVLNDMCAAMWFTYVLLFFEKVLNLGKDSAGTILLIGQVVDGISTVFVGICVDKQNDFWLCNRIGKRQAWHLIGTVFVMISFPFIFMEIVGVEDPDSTSQTTKMIYYSIFVILFQFGWAAVQISHLSIIPDLTKHESERTSLTSKRYFEYHILMLVCKKSELNLTPLKIGSKLLPKVNMTFN